MSIRQKIVLSFLGIVLLLMASLGSVLLFHTRSLEEYKNISNTLILENTLINDVDKLLEAYIALETSTTSEESMARYLNQRDGILQMLQQLDSALMDEDSQTAYQALKNITESTIADLEKGRELLVQGDMAEAHLYYTHAIDKKIYIESNGTLLLFKELQHLEDIKKTIDDKYNKQLFVMIMSIFITMLVMLLYALVFSRRITTPMKVLEGASQKVVSGDYSSRIPEDLLAGSDEVSKLANVINLMLITINTKITEVNDGNDTILETQKHLEDRNRELEKFNKVVIGREVKMVELKSRVASLEKDLETLQTKS